MNNGLKEIPKEGQLNVQTRKGFSEKNTFKKDNFSDVKKDTNPRVQDLNYKREIHTRQCVNPKIMDVKYKENILKLPGEKNIKPFKRSLPTIKFLITMLEVSGIMTSNDFTPGIYTQTIKYKGILKNIKNISHQRNANI